MTNVLILCGGESPEHEISLRSARNIVQAIDKSRFKVETIGIDPNGRWFQLDRIPDSLYIQDGIPVSLDLQQKCWKSSGTEINPDVVFPVLHGPNGEDGSVQGLLQALNLPFVSPSVLGSSLAMDKEAAKAAMNSAGIRVAEGITLISGESYDANLIISELALPLFVKPANMGSSVGVTKVAKAENLEAAIQEGFRFDSKVLIEKMVKGRELECAVLGLLDDQSVTAPGEIISAEEYSFDEKYSEASTTRLMIPAEGLTSELMEQLKDTALNACRALNCEILSRVDMFLTEDHKIYVNEVNTIPGFTNISMYPKLWEYEGISYTELITRLLELAISRQKRIDQLQRKRIN